MRYRTRLTVLALIATTLAFAAPSRAADPGVKDTAVDASVRPGDDFYAYANGLWLKSATIPQGQSTYGTGVLLREINKRRVRELIEAAAADRAARGVEQKVGDFYASVSDASDIEAKGLAPLKPDLDAIAAIADRRALSAYLGGTLRADVDGNNHVTERLFGLMVFQGFDNTARNYPHLLQGGLGMPDRDDYLDASPAKAALRDRYRAHLASILRLSGEADADARAARVLALETDIARAHAPSVDAEDPAKENNLWRRADFDSKAPGMSWTAWFAGAGLTGQDDVLVWEPKAVAGISGLVAQTPLSVWRDYLRAHLIDRYASVLPKAFADEHFAFFGAALTGATAPDPRSDQAIALTNTVLGEAVGRLYAERYFPPAAKARAVAMVDNLRAAYRVRIPTLTWASQATRSKALVKLDTLEIGIGYPDRWINYSSLAIVRNDALGNLRRAEMFAYHRSLAKLATPVAPGEWAISPQAVGAVIQFTPNAIDFAAGILQPPYFDPAGDDASNYGSAGAAIAHELSHTFDELGNQYDETGRVAAWWTPDDVTRYHAAAAPLVSQFNAYCPRAGLCVNGQQVMGENIADLTGLLIAHDAYEMSLHGRPDVVIDGFTGEQRFFLAYARRWRVLTTDAALRQQIASDIHPPGEYRSDAVRNVQAWYDAFDVKPGDKLYVDPAARAHIW